jgi:hypothetical protein
MTGIKVDDDGCPNTLPPGPLDETIDRRFSALEALELPGRA